MSDDTESSLREALIALLYEEAEAAAATDASRDGLHPVAREGVLPLSFTQQRIWFLEQFAAGQATFNIPAVVRLTGPLDATALAAALAEVLRRHEVLRTGFVAVDGVPRQRILPESVPGPALDPVPVDEAAMPARLAAMIGQPFDLTQGPLLRAALFRLGEQDHVVAIVVHHIVADGWSIAVLVREMAALYDAFAHGRPSPLPALPIQYADYAHWQRQRLDGEALETALAFWRAQLDGAPALLALPSDRPRPEAQSHRGATTSQLLPLAELERLQQSATRARTTLFAVLLAGLQATLAAWTGQRDMVLGTVVAGRDEAELECLIGCLMNSLALRVRSEADESFDSLLQRTAATTLDAYSHQDVPFEKVIEAVNPERDAAYNPVFNVALLLQNFPDEDHFGEGLRADSVETGQQKAELDLRFVLQTGSAGLHLGCEYATDLFDAATIDALLSFYRTVLTDCVREPRRELGAIALPAALQARREAAQLAARGTTVVIASSFTAEPVDPALRYWLHRFALAPNLVHAPYGQIFQSLLDPRGAFAGNAGGANAILLRWEDWLRDTAPGGAVHEHEAMLQHHLDDLVAALGAASAQSTASWFVVLCPASQARLANPAEAACLAALDARLAATLAAMPGVHVTEAASLLRRYPVADYDDAHADAVGHVPYVTPMYTAIGTALARAIVASRTKPKKVIVLDCDDTLWQGICAESGPAGVVVSPGRAALQEFMIAQYRAGVLLCLCSKNVEADVDATFAGADGMRLRPDHIVSRRVNWQRKSDNIRSLAEELQLGLDSFVFIDDSAAECEQVRQALPEVLVLQVPERDADIAGWIGHVWALDRLKVTGDASRRTEQYRQNRQREAVRAEAPSFESFLASLALEVEIAPVGERDIERVAELTQRTNQFNVRPAPLNAGDIRALGAAGVCATVRVRDRFGDYGLTGVLAYHVEGDSAQVDTLLLSCRVLGRGVEHRVLAWLAGQAAQAGCQRIVVPYVVTERNDPAIGFLSGIDGIVDDRAQARFGIGIEHAARVVPAAAAPASIAESAGQDAAGIDETASRATPAPAARERAGHDALFERIAAEDNGAAAIAQRIAALDRRVNTHGLHVVPRPGTESLIAAIWTEILGLDRVGAQDNFFRLGGHSLLATQIMSRVSRALGVDLPLRSLFEAPVLSAFAALVDAASVPGGAGSGTAVGDITPVPRGDALPLSYAQQRLWFLDQLQPPGSTFFHVPIALRLTGRLDVDVVERTLTEIVRRHEALRTCFPAIDGVPVQRVQPAGPMPVPVEVLPEPAHGADGGAAWLHERLAVEAAAPFDLADGPLIRARLFRLAAGEHVIALTLHHIVSDGWSIGVLVREVAALYDAFSRGEASPLAELPVQYVDYAHWQRHWLAGPVLDGQIDYWRAQLAGAPALLTLPTDRPRPAVLRHRGAIHRFDIDTATTAGLHALAREAQGTLFMTLATAFGILLARHAGQDEVCIGTPIANRRQSQTEDLIGIFFNTLVLRQRIEARESFGTLLARTRETTLGAYAHQDVPFEQLVEVLQPQRSLGHTPLFQVVLALQNAPLEDMALPGLRIAGLESRPDAQATSRFDLSLEIVEAADGLNASFEYDTDLFDAVTIERMAARFVRLLGDVVARPTARVGELEMMAADEREIVIGQWNETAVRHPSELTLASWFEAQADLTPDAVALAFGAEALRYASLNAKANRLAHHLRTLGVGPDVRVGLCMERSAEMVIGLLAVLKAGGVYLPLDPAYPASRLAYMLEDAAPVVVLTRADVSAGLIGAYPSLMIDGDDFDAYPDTNPAALAHPEHLAYVIYTSGSTGVPKGVGGTHRSMVNRLAWMQSREPAQVGQRHVQKTSLNFIDSVTETLAPLMGGATLSIVDGETARDPLKLWNRVIEQGASRLTVVPSLLRTLLELGQTAPAGMLLVSSGEALSSELAARVGEVWPNVRLLNLYGSSEVAGDALAYDVVDVSDAGGVPIGRPIANTQVYLLDGAGQPVPLGVVGELYVGGASLARGYLNRPDLTAERFMPSPFGEAGSRLYRTGDLARYLPDGTIDYIGRADHQVKIRGFRIELGEIEAALASYLRVRDVAVVARADADDLRLIAYLVSDGNALDAAELRTHLQQTLPDYMVPSHFVALDALPLTPNGKLDRLALPEPDAAGMADGYLEPRTETETLLAGIWAAVLKLDRVGAQDNFFDLGGHSLLATRVLARLRKALGVELPVRALFKTPVLADLAAWADEVRRGATPDAQDMPPPIALVPRDQPLPLSYAQQRMWFLDQLEPGSAFYNLPAAVRLHGELDAAVLHRTLNEVVRRHEALRTCFVVENEVVRQQISATPNLALPLVDLSMLPEAARQEALHTQLAAQAAAPFDLSTGPLIRALLVRLDAADHVVALSLHHIVSDGWSTGVLVREVAALYTAFSRGEPSPLADLPVQYADYAHWQRAWLTDAVQERQLAYWRTQLADAPALLTLPTDRPRPPVQRHRGAVHRFDIDATTTAGLQALAKRVEGTLFMALATAFGIVLSRHAGQHDICIGTPIANRRDAQTEDLIGFFANTLVLRQRIDRRASVATLLARTRETALGAYAHQDVPFEQLVEDLKPQRSLGHSPLFQVMLILQNAPFEAMTLPGLSLSGVDGDTATTAKFDLSLNVETTDEGLHASLEYDTDLFDRGTIERMAGHVRRVLTAMAQRPDARSDTLPMLDDDESRQMIEVWNETDAAWPSQRTLASWFEEQVDLTPDAVAVVSGGEGLDYASLNAKANRLAHHLRTLGVGPDVRVGLCMERSAEVVVGLLAVLKAGGVYLPLDPAYPAERLAYMLEDAAPVVVLTR
uniref:non-ribosomal peptide synthetase n=1 Tax=Burkholderia gladioli TaxID=28095 RepID=UPI001641D0FB